MAGLKCGFCKRGTEVENDCGVLHHVDETERHLSCTAHHKCMQYSAKLVQYKSDYFGGFKVNKVLEEQKRGRSAKCAICAKLKRQKKQSVAVSGGTAGCAVQKCKKSFHFFCAKNSKECVTKRLIVSYKTSKKETVLYRVFCSKGHEQLYRENIKQNIPPKDRESSSSSGSSGESVDDSEEEEEEEEEDKSIKTSFRNDDNKDKDKSMKTDFRSNNNKDKDKSTKTDFRSNNNKDKEKSIETNLKSNSRRESKITSNGIDTDSNGITDCSYIDISPRSSEKLPKSVKRSLLYSDESECKKFKESVAVEIETMNTNHRETKHVSFCELSPESDLDDEPIANKAESKNLNYALCILSTTENIDVQRQEITEVITSTRNAIDRVVIWQDISSEILDQELTPYFILTVSKEIRSAKTLNQLLFSEKYLKEKRGGYEYQCNFFKDLQDSEVMKNVLQNTWKTVSEYLCKATKCGEESVGELVKTSENGHVLILYLTDAIDENNTIRSHLHTENELFLWKDNSSVCHVSNGLYNQEEVEILTKCINSYMEKISHVFLLPEDVFLRKNQHYQSVVNHLVEKYKSVKKSQANASTCLILLSELESNVVNCSSYILRMLDHIIGKELSNFSCFLALLPVFDLPKSFRFEEEITKFLKNRVDIKVFSAGNPVEKEISCVLVELKISAYSTANRKTRTVTDGEKPTTSGTSTSRWLRANLAPSAIVCQQNSRQKR